VAFHKSGSQGMQKSGSYLGFDWTPQQPISVLKAMIQKKGLNFLREQILTDKTINALPVPKLKEMVTMLNELQPTMNLDKNDLESFVKHCPNLNALYSVLKELNYPEIWYDGLLAEIRGARSAFDRQALEAEKKGLVQFLYEFAKARHDVSLFKRLQNAVLGLDYLEKEVLSRLPSTLKITVHCGSNLASKDSNGYSDPYIKFTVGDEKHGKTFKTKIVWKTLDPSWEETFEFKNDGSVHMNNLPITFYCWDKDVVGSDDYMGECIVDCSAPWAGEIIARTGYELNNSSKTTSKVSGSLFISVEAVK